jgi:hypothetical protein
MSLFERLGRRFPKHFGPGHVALAKQLFTRWGVWAVFFGRFVALLRILAGPLAGALRMRYRYFLAANAAGAICWAGGKFYEAKHRPGLEIMDRVGGGDSFASGLIYGFLSGADPQTAVDYGAVHGALAMTTPGDTSMASLAEVKKLAGGGGARVER